ncbi:MAG: hypothetical protein ACYC1C_19400, partial [Chloroflexota bacterium]
MSHVCLAIGVQPIQTMFGLLMDGTKFQIREASAQPTGEGITLKALDAAFTLSNKDASRGNWSAPPLVFDPAIGGIHLHELDVKWEKLDVAFVVRVQERDITILGHTLRLFEGTPTLEFTVSIAKFVKRSEIDVHLAPEIRSRQADGHQEWSIGFSRAMVQFDAFDLEGNFEDMVVEGLRQEVARAASASSGVVDALAAVHMANPAFELQYRHLSIEQRWEKARLLAVDDLTEFV